jgi:hypothetical protein
LAIICNSLADLGVKNDTLFAEIAKVLYIRYEEMNSGFDSGSQIVKPIDCAQFLTAFSRNQFFDDDLFKMIGQMFERTIEREKNGINSETLVTMYCAH